MAKIKGIEKCGKSVIHNLNQRKVWAHNEFRYFDNIEPEDWEYQIGGYKVLYQYLKSRKGRQMEDPGHFCRIVEALKNTIKLQAHLSALVVF